MNREQEYTTCLLMVGPPPPSPNTDNMLAGNAHVRVRKLEDWRGQVLSWYFKHVLKQHFPILIGKDRDSWKQWMRDYCWWLKEQGDGV